MYWHTTQLCRSCNLEHRFCFKGNELPNQNQKTYYKCPMKKCSDYIEGIYGWSSNESKETNSVDCFITPPKN